jgi:hypothetical protein
MKYYKLSAQSAKYRHVFSYLSEVNFYIRVLLKYGMENVYCNISAAHLDLHT